MKDALDETASQAGIVEEEPDEAGQDREKKCVIVAI
jgi:hypothetical protein